MEKKRFRSEGKIQNPTQVVIRLEKDVWDKIKEFAKSRNMSTNAYVRNILKREVWFEDQKHKEENRN